MATIKRGIPAVGEIPADAPSEIIDWADDVVKALAHIDYPPAVNVIAEYGAIGDGVADDTAAIQAAFDDSDEASVILFPPGTYKISSTITVDRAMTIMGHGATLNYGDNTGTALFLGVTGTGAIFSNGGMRVGGLNVTKTFTVGGIAADELLGRGVVHSNIKQGRLSDMRISGFKNGLLVQGDGGGNFYNTFLNNQISDCFIGLQAEGKNGGFATESLFLGGRITISTGFNDYTGTKYVSIPESQGDNHRFFGVTLEGGDVERKVDCSGVDNIFFGCRWEASNNSIDVHFRAPSAIRNVLYYGNGLLRTKIEDEVGRNHVIQSDRQIFQGATSTATLGTFVLGNADTNSIRPVLAIAKGKASGITTDDITFKVSGEGEMSWRSTAGGGFDVNLERRAVGGLSTDDSFSCGSLGVSNSATAATLGTVTDKVEVFDEAGASLGFLPVYDAIT